MVVDRNNVWAPVGLDLTGSTSIDEALRKAELDFTVEKQFLYDQSGVKIPGYFMNRRSDNGNVLGIVTGKYNIVQNREAFDFINNLIPEGIEFEKGGVWHNGRAVWVEAKLPGEYNILGDKVESHVVFINAHDGKSSVRVCMLPTRLVCSNQLALAIKNATRCWAAIHSSKIEGKIEEAKSTLLLADKYMDALSNEMETMAKKPMTKDEFRNIVDEVYPVDTNDSNRKRTNTVGIRTALMQAYDAPDLDNFNGTAYKAIQSVADFMSHRQAQRNTNEFYDARFMKLVGKDQEADKLYSRIMAA